MLNAAWWLLVVEVVGLAAFPLIYHLLPSLRDRGYSVSKPFGLLVVGYVSWILSQLHLAPSTQITLVGMVALMAGLSGWLLWVRRADFMLFLRSQWRLVVLAELVFLVFFIGWTFYRAYDPAIDHTEQPMDFAFLNASVQTTTGSPQDPWLSGESVSYYYFGYWMMGVLTELTGIASNISYNLAMALIPAMAAQAVFGLVYSAVRSQTSRFGPALAGSIAAILLLGVVANLEGGLEFMRANGMGSQGFWEWVEIKEDPSKSDSELMTKLDSANVTDSWSPTEFWWWFRGTRVIGSYDGLQWTDLTIQEFPFFSFMLGDLHAHVMAIPFALLAIAFCWELFRKDFHLWSWRGPISYVHVLAFGLVLGGLAFTNMWDFPTYASLLLGVAVLKAYSLRTRPDGDSPSSGTVWMPPLLLAVGSVALAVLLFLPYYLTFKSSVSGIDPVQAATTRPAHLFFIWGLYVVAVGPFIVVTFWRTTLHEDWRRTAGLALGIVALPLIVWAFLHMEKGGAGGEIWGRLFDVLPLALMIAIAVYTAFWSVREDGPTGMSFTLALSALGLILIMGPELLFVDDSFGNRMNTIFKLYYQAWILMAVATGFVLFYWVRLRDSLSGWRRGLTTVWAGAVSVLLLASLYYPPAAAASKSGPFSGDITLDGLAYLNRSRPAERDAIEFVRQQVGRESTIIEAVGEWSESGLISRSTGIPTVFNWPGHEIQWRGSSDSFGSREQDIADIYQSVDWDEAENLMARYDVEYVYVGPRERSKYGTEGLEKFGEHLGPPVFSRDDVLIYRVKDER